MTAADTHTHTHTLAATSRCNTVISVLLMDLKANVFIALLLSQRCSTFNIYTISLIGYEPGGVFLPPGGIFYTIFF